MTQDRYVFMLGSHINTATVSNNSSGQAKYCWSGHLGSSMRGSRYHPRLAGLGTVGSLSVMVIVLQKEPASTYFTCKCGPAETGIVRTFPVMMVPSNET